MLLVRMFYKERTKSYLQVHHRLQALPLLLAHKIMLMVLMVQALRKRTYLLQALIIQVLKKSKKII